MGRLSQWLATLGFGVNMEISFNKILIHCKELIFMENDNQKIFQLIKNVENLDYENHKFLARKLSSISSKYSVENMVNKFDKYIFSKYK